MSSTDGNDHIGRDIFRAANLVTKALREVDAMFYQLDVLFPNSDYPSAEKIRGIETWKDRYYIEDPNSWTVHGTLMNYAVRRKGENGGKHPSNCLTVFAQIAPSITEADIERDPLLVRESLLHVLYNNGGPWDDSEEPIWLNQTALTDDGYQLVGDSLWWYSEEGYHGWLYSAPLTEIKKPDDLRRIVVEPASRLLTSLDRLPEETEVQDALGANQSLIRYTLDGDTPLILHPERLASS